MNVNTLASTFCDASEGLTHYKPGSYAKLVVPEFSLSDAS